MKKQLQLAFYLTVLCLAQSVWAKAWDGKTDPEWYWENPDKTEFTITTAEQLAGLAQLVNGGNDFSGKTIKLGTSIMLNDTVLLPIWKIADFKPPNIKPPNAWTPIGSSDKEDRNDDSRRSNSSDNDRPFSGTFDGGGNIISGIYINNSKSYQGLFGYTASNATIKNLGVTASYVKGYRYIGGLVGVNGGTITDCYAIGDSFSGGGFVGGLVGINEKGTITNSYAIGSVEGKHSAGGLVGENERGAITNSSAIVIVKGGSGLVGNNIKGTITNSYATGKVEGGSGLVGKNEGGTITDCYATGNVNGGSGLVGRNECGTITNSYATGNVSGGSGLVGTNYCSDEKIKSSIKNSFATGNVKGGSGLVGSNGGTVTDCYAMGNISNSPSSVGYSSSIIGGLVGENSGTITNCYAIGYIKGNIPSYKNQSVTDVIGGLVGENSGAIANCYAMGYVAGSTTGGLVGKNSKGTITNCYAMGEVTGSTAGGLVGENIGVEESIGRKRESILKGTIENSYSTGNVKGAGSTVGGLVGVNSSGTIEKSYYDRQTSGQSDIVKGYPKSTAQMKQQAIFEDWDFDGTWKIDESKNNGYPYLQASEKSLPVKYKYPQKIQYGNVLTDKRDNKKYKTVVINTQTWMAENLNYNASGSKCYGEGETTSLRDKKGKFTKGPKYSSAEIQAHCQKYGRLYDWKTALKACPSGWHLPTNKEWNELHNYANMYASGAGIHLRATSGWNEEDNGTDNFGFAALPSGEYSYYSGYGGYWWSSSELMSSDAYRWSIHYRFDRMSIVPSIYEVVGLDGIDKSTLLNVRCVQD